MEKKTKGVILRKRTQISKANRNMFLWVAGASIVFGFAAVAAVYLGKMALFNEKVIQEKNKTISILKKNNENVPKLEALIRVLDTNKSLMALKADPDDQAVQVILDALPSEANSLALGASIQRKILGTVENVTLNALQVDPVIGVESLIDFNSVENASSSDSTTSGEITFRFSIAGQSDVLEQVLVNLEKSIRTIDIISIKIESQGESGVGLTVQAKAYYEPKRTIELKEKTLRP